MNICLKQYYLSVSHHPALHRLLNSNHIGLTFGSSVRPRSHNLTYKINQFLLGLQFYYLHLFCLSVCQQDNWKSLSTNFDEILRGVG